MVRKATTGLFRRLFSLRFFSYLRRAHFRALNEQLNSAGFEFARFERTIQYHPRDWKLFLQALLHRSYLQFIEGEWESNERLEFLGDSILNSTVAEYLYRTFPDMEEGNLTKVRSRLVNRRILALRAKELKFSEFMLVSNSAAQSIGSGSDSILADAFEAVLGAVYLDGGPDAARSFVERTLLASKDAIEGAKTDDNFKSALLEYSQGHSLGAPRYVVVREDGPEHDRRFTVEVSVGTQMYGVGTGRSKKDAEQAAASQALDRIHHEQPIDQPSS